MTTEQAVQAQIYIRAQAGNIAAPYKQRLRRLQKHVEFEVHRKHRWLQVLAHGLLLVSGAIVSGFLSVFLFQSTDISIKPVFVALGLVSLWALCELRIRKLVERAIDCCYDHTGDPLIERTRACTEAISLFAHCMEQAMQWTDVSDRETVNAYFDNPRMDLGPQEVLIRLRTIVHAHMEAMRTDPPLRTGHPFHVSKDTTMNELLDALEQPISDTCGSARLFVVQSPLPAETGSRSR